MHFLHTEKCKQFPLDNRHDTSRSEYLLCPRRCPLQQLKKGVLSAFLSSKVKEQEPWCLMQRWALVCRFPSHPVFLICHFQATVRSSRLCCLLKGERAKILLITGDADITSVAVLPVVCRQRLGSLCFIFGMPALVLACAAWFQMTDARVSRGTSGFRCSLGNPFWCLRLLKPGILLQWSLAESEKEKQGPAIRPSLFVRPLKVLGLKGQLPGSYDTD